jgi:hypothetical protein
MAVQEIPRSFRYTCDICETTHIQEGAGGTYPNSTPPFWSRLQFVASPSFKEGSVQDHLLLLCNNCTGAASAKIGQLIRREWP